MPRVRHTTTDIHNALHGLLDADETRADDGHPEWKQLVYHGRPATLLSTLLHGFGASMTQLKSLDAMDVPGTEWTKLKHPLRNRFTPLAWLCLAWLRGGPEEGDWALAHAFAFHRSQGPSDYILPIEDRDRRLRPWLYDQGEIDQTGAEDGQLHPGCGSYPVRHPYWFYSHPYWQFYGRYSRV